MRAVDSPEVVLPHLPERILVVRQVHAVEAEPLQQFGEFPVNQLERVHSRLAPKAAADPPRDQQGLVRHALSIASPDTEAFESLPQVVGSGDHGNR